RARRRRAALDRRRAAQGGPPRPDPALRPTLGIPLRPTPPQPHLRGPPRSPLRAQPAAVLAGAVVSASRDGDCFARHAWSLSAVLAAEARSKDSDPMNSLAPSRGRHASSAPFQSAA